MCEQCHLSVCSSRCPNAPAAHGAYTCAYCGENILPGEEAVRVGGSCYHQECLENNAVDILFQNFGAEAFTAAAQEE